MRLLLELTLTHVSERGLRSRFSTVNRIFTKKYTQEIIKRSWRIMFPCIISSEHTQTPTNGVFHQSQSVIIVFRPKQNGRHLADDIHFFSKKTVITLFVFDWNFYTISNQQEPVFIQRMVWHPNNNKLTHNINIPWCITHTIHMGKRMLNLKQHLRQNYQIMIKSENQHQYTVCIIIYVHACKANVCPFVESV